MRHESKRKNKIKYWNPIWIVLKYISMVNHLNLHDTIHFLFNYLIFFAYLNDEGRYDV